MIFARVKDPKLRAQLVAAASQLKASRATPVSPMLFIRLAASQPLLFAPGTRFHHSNIGWNIAGLIVERAAGQSLPALYEARIFKPLGLTHTSYQPQGPIMGPHAEGYLIAPNGSLTDATAWTFGKGADGAMVTDATDDATFLRALMGSRLHVRQLYLDFLAQEGVTGGGPGSCPGNPLGGTGTGDASRSYIYVATAGNRIAVLLLNGRRASTGAEDPKASAAAASLYCGA